MDVSKAGIQAMCLLEGDCEGKLWISVLGAQETAAFWLVLTCGLFSSDEDNGVGSWLLGCHGPWQWARV